MHLDYRITKPSTLRGYPLHRMVAGLTGGMSFLFSDEGHSLLVRSDAEVAQKSAKPVKTLTAGELTAFELRACVSKKKKGKHIYFPLKDWRARHEWLQRQGEKNGFEVLTVHSTSDIAPIDDGRRSFKIDQTDFTGILKVIDQELFANGMVKGIGSTAKTFGFGMLVIE